MTIIFTSFSGWVPAILSLSSQISLLQFSGSKRRKYTYIMKSGLPSILNFKNLKRGLLAQVATTPGLVGTTI